jgi:hypothetical protein
MILVVWSLWVSCSFLGFSVWRVELLSAIISSPAMENRPFGRYVTVSISNRCSTDAEVARAIIRGIVPAKRKSHKPPFRKGLDPLFEAGLIDKISEPLVKFLVFCEKTYLENMLLREALGAAAVDDALGAPRPLLTTQGSPGHHRKVFDPWYLKIGREQQAKRTYRQYAAGKGGVH